MRTALFGLTLPVIMTSSLLHWESLPALPDREGFAGSYAGVSGNALIVAGGANFPEQRPWEGGTKHWYNRVFVLEPGASQWREVGNLPRAGGYGVALSAPEGALFIGGGDAERNFSEGWLARYDGKAVTFTPLPAMPLPLAMSAGALVGRTVYVAGGLEKPDAAKAENVTLVLDLDHLAQGWQKLPPCPGGERFLATAAGDGGAFYLIGGARLVSGANGKPQREWLRDAWRYTAGEGWHRLADLPHAVVAAPSPAPVVDGRVLVLGGDDGAQVSVAPTAHRGFPRDVLAYDPQSDQWTVAGTLPFGLVTTSTAFWRGSVVVPGGEQRPGVRSPQVWMAKLPQATRSAK